MVGVSLLDPDVFRRYWRQLYAVSLLLLLLVIPLGTEARGSQRWLGVGALTFQPSELGKLLVVLAVAGFLAERARRVGEVGTVLGAIGLTAIPTVLVFMQPDIGTSLVYGAALAAMLFVAGTRWLHVVALVTTIAVAAGLVVWLLPSLGVDVLEPYQRDRLTAFVDRESDPQGASYNVQQSILAVGAGGLRGRGVDNSTQTNLDYLPEHATDFAFASLAEQRGFVGAAILLLLYLLVVWRGLRVVTYASDPYSAIVASGIVFALLFQVFVNVGMTMGIAPVTGIPLPFVSVGGSSLVTNLLAHRRAAGDPRPRATTVRAKLPLAPFAVLKLLRELRSTTADRRPLVLGGARSLVDALRRELVRDGDASAVREEALGAMVGAAALVYVLAGEPTEEDERALRAADLAGVPLLVVGPEPTTPIPYALATDVLPLRPGEGFPLEELGRRLAAKDENAAVALAAQAAGASARRRGRADRARRASERGDRRGGVRPRRRLPGADPEPASPRAAPRRGVRRGDRRRAAPGDPRRRRRARSGSARSRVRRSASSRSPAGRCRARSPTAGTRTLGEAAIRYFEALRGRAESGAPGADRA